MTKLSEYVERAADEYLHDRGDVELDPRWTAEFFDQSGLLDEYPAQDLVAFHDLVQKALTLRAERAAKQGHRVLGNVVELFKKRPEK